MVDLEYLKDLHWNWDDFTPVPEKHTEKGTEYFVNSLRFPPLGDIYSKNSIYSLRLLLDCNRNHNQQLYTFVSWLSDCAHKIVSFLNNLISSTNF